MTNSIREDGGGQTWEVWTPAKINLFLEILRRRTDGYHELETVMAAVSLFDTLQFRVSPGPAVRVDTTWTSGIRATYRHSPQAVGDVPSLATNIVTRALTLLQERAEVGYGAEVRLWKRIPSAAGLGGASSNAAAALAVANVAWQLNWSCSELQQVAAELGSDVPFFLSNSPAAVCRGRGEQIDPVGWFWRPAIVLVRPPQGLSTPAVYRQVVPPGQPRSCQGFLHAVQGGSLAEVKKQIVNRLQGPASQLSPWIARLEQAFNRLPVLAHQMSGSGSSYFGLCRNFREAQQIANRLRAIRVGHVMPITTTRAYPIIRRRGV